MKQDLISIDEYFSRCWRYVGDYIEGVEDGSIPTNWKIKKQVKIFRDDLNRSDLEFRTEEVDNVFKFAYMVNLIHNNEVIRFHMLPYECFFLAAIYGFYYKNTNDRKIREAILFMGKGNGKSPLAAFLVAYTTLVDVRINPEALLLANTRRQAGISLGFVRKMIFSSPVLDKRLEPYNYRILFRNRRRPGFIEILSSDLKSMDGYAANIGILDEVHEYRNADIYNMIKGAVQKKHNSILLLITTAGTNKRGFLYNKLQYYEAVLRGDIKDDTIFAALYTLDEGDDVEDTTNWYKANPGLDYIFPLKDLEKLYQSSRYSGSELNNFMTKRLNEFKDAETSWINDDTLSEVFGEIDIDLTGQDVYIGIDLSQNRDLTSIVCLFEVDNKYYVIPYFFMPNNSEKVMRAGGVNIIDWITEGYIIESDRPTINYDQIVDTLIEINHKYNIKRINYDPANSALFLDKVLNSGEKIRSKCTPFAQSAMTFNTPLKYLEKVIFDGNITLTNPALKWQMNNVVLYVDGNQNIKIMKNKSKDSVDGAVALGMAMGANLSINSGYKDIKELYK